MFSSSLKFKKLSTSSLHNSMFTMASAFGDMVSMWVIKLQFLFLLASRLALPTSSLGRLFIIGPLLQVIVFAIVLACIFHVFLLGLTLVTPSPLPPPAFKSARFILTISSIWLLRPIWFICIFFSTSLPFSFVPHVLTLFGAFSFLNFLLFFLFFFFFLLSCFYSLFPRYLCSTTYPLLLWITVHLPPVSILH